MKFTFLTLRLHIFGIYASLAYGDECGKSEYMSAAKECCPMCSIGSVILKDCYGDYSTTCKQCSKGTFMNEPNGLHKCFQCKNCDSGLSILHDCTIIRDTVCDVGDGYYCINYLNITRECSFAVKHTHCKPEQRIKTPGTKVSDTVCEPCPPGFYSHDGVNCSELTEVQYNTRTWNMRYGLIPCILLLAIICFYLKHPSAFERCITVKKPVEETSPHISEFAPSSSQLEKNEESEALQPDEDEDEDVTK